MLIPYERQRDKRVRGCALSTYHKRSPIKRHGTTPPDQFVMIPNKVARDPELSTRGARVLLLMLSHTDGYEVSVRSMSEQLGCQRTVINGALEDLVNARYVAITRCRKHNGRRAYDTYHVNIDGKFAEDEHAEHHRVVSLPPPDGGQTVAPEEDQGPVPNEGHTVVPDEGHKEDQPEHQLEEQGENQAAQSESIHDDPYCQECEDAKYNVCMIHLHDRQYRYREPVEDTQALPGLPSSVPNKLEENACQADECDQPAIPKVRWCVQHLACWKHEPRRQQFVAAGPDW